MASSSSAPAPEPSPYEVFLSFRGEDTRNNFVSHLRSALERRGIITYFDETNLQNGQTISIELVKAIHESVIAIVVLSKNYGSSTWCLNELVKIVECKNKNKLTIYPIFYDVDPSDVRKEQNNFFKAFSIHEVNFKDKIEMVNAWREALREISNLTGVDIRGKNEASCIEKIANEILWNLPLEASHFTESLVGIEPRISYLKDLIYSNSDEVRFIGIWGMGGVGKTTTAIAVFDECKSEFDGSCLLLDVGRRKNEMVKLQQELISEVLNCEIGRIYNVNQGSSMIRKRMCSKRVLLVVDDVDDIHQLNVLAGRCDWFGKGSRIIITTRDDHLLNDVHDKYYVHTLNDKEALLLFRNHAFKNEHPEENYKELSHKVLSYACGLPLALEVLGDHLRKREESVWCDTLERLKKVPEERIISILQISFDKGLNSLQQDIFLYIACVFRGKNRNDVMKCLRALGLHPEEGIKVLIGKSLVHESRSSFGMHDLLQDMGHHIIRQRANWNVREYSHIWLYEDMKTILLDYKGSAEAEGIIISEFNDDAIVSKLLKEESFMNMKKLRFLQINHENVFQFSVQLPYGLQCLHWGSYKGKSLGTPDFSMNLVHMEMSYSFIERTPDFSLMPKLEVLNLRNSFKLVHIHPSLGHHTNIKRIDLSLCRELKEFPAIIGMNSLEYLNLNWTSLESFPELFGNVDLLKELHMQNSQIDRTPDFSLMPNLEVLDLSHSDNLVHVHLGLNMKIKRVDLEGCVKLEEFPAIIQKNSLEYLNLHFTGLQSFPEIHGNVDSLKELDISDTDIKGLPTSIQYATGLRNLKLESLDDETTQLGSLSSFEYLHSLSIEHVRRHIAIPELPSSLQILKIFESSLKEYPKSFPNQLKTLKITCSNIERTPDFSHLLHLLELDLSSSYQLSEVHGSLGVHKNIVVINLMLCINLKKFPTIVDMRSLKTLNLSYTKLKCFPEITGNVDKLENLELEGTCISTLPQSIGRATGLKELNITLCEDLVSLPISVQPLENLVIWSIGTDSIPIKEEGKHVTLKTKR